MFLAILRYINSTDFHTDSMVFEEEFIAVLLWW